MPDFPPQYATEYPAGSGFVVVANTNGSSDWHDWTPAGYGELGSQSWEDFASDFETGNGHLDNYHDANGDPADGDDLGGGGEETPEDPVAPGAGGEGEQPGGEGGEGAEGGADEGGEGGEGGEDDKDKEKDSKPSRQDLLDQIADLEIEAGEIQEQLEEIGEEIQDLADELAGLGEDEGGSDNRGLSDAANAAGAAADTLDGVADGIADEADRASAGDPLAEPGPGNGTAPDGLGDTPRGGEPVGLLSGAFMRGETDLHAPGPGFDFALTRSYVNQLYASGLLGPKWRLCFEDSVRVLSSQRVVRTTGDGVTLIYEPTSVGWDAPAGVPELLARDGAGWKISDNFGIVRRFASDGKLSSITDRFGNAIELTWSGAKLTQVEDSAGRTWAFSYNAAGLLTSVTGPDGAAVRYGYASGRLTAVTLPDPSVGVTGPAFSYSYRDGSDARLLHNLTRIAETGGSEIASSTYGTSGDSFNRVIRQNFQGGVFEFEYDVYDGGQDTTMTGIDGTVTIHKFDAEGHLIERRLLTRGAQPGAPASYETVFETAANGLPSRVIQPGGGTTEYTWDEAGDALRQANLVIARRRPVVGAPLSQSTTESYQYGPYSQVSQIRAANGAVTDFVLNAQGMPEQIRLAPVSIDGGVAQRPSVELDWRSDGQLLERRDPGGLVTSYVYYSDAGRRGLVKEITQTGSGHQRKQIFARDANGRITAMTIPGGRSFEYVLDGRGRPTEMRRNGELTRVWEYDRYDRVLKVRTRRTEPDGSTSNPEWVQTVFAYDTYGRIAESRVEAGGRILERLRYGYDPGGAVTSIEAANGSVQTMDYDERGLVVKETRAAGTAQETATEFRYDADGALTELIDPRGNSWLRELDGLGRVIATIDPTGCRDEITLDGAGQPIEMRRLDPGGVARMRVGIERNAHGRVVARKTAKLSAVGATQSWLQERTFVDIEGNPIRAQAANGAISHVQFDAFGAPVRETDPAGNEVRYEYEATGALSRTTRVERLGTGTLTLARTFQRDIDGRPLRCVDSLGREETMRYDGQGLLREATLADGTKIESDYDEIGRMIASRTLGSAGKRWTTEITYDRNGLVTKIKDPGGHDRDFSYDPLGRLTSVRDARGVTRSALAYDPAGAITRLTDARGVIVDHVVDPLGRITQRAITAPAGVTGARTETFAYDALGNPVHAENENAVVTNAYDSLSLMTESVVDGLSLRHTYNAGQRTQSTYPSGFKINAGRDDLGRLTSLTAPAPAAGIAAGTLASWAWQGRALPAERTTPGGVKATWKQDRLGRPLLLDVKRGGTSLLSEIEIRDAVDRVLLRETKAPGGGGRRATYDVRGELVEHAPIVSVGNPVTLANSLRGTSITQADLNAAAASPARTAAAATTFKYDDDGNRGERKVGSAPRTLYTYDSVDRLTAAGGVANTWDDAGNLLNDGTYSYSYDFASRLTRVSLNATGAVMYSCDYDALGRPASMRVDGRDLTVVHDGDRPIELRTPAGALDTLLVWGARDGELVALGRSGTARYGVNGLHGDVAMLTTAAGAVDERYGYDAFGARKILSPSGTARAASVAANPFGYLGRPHVSPELVNMRARHLHTGWGRFTTADPASGIDGPNPYIYGANDPLSRADLDGHSATVVGGALGLAFGVGWAVGSMINAGIYEATGGEWGEQWQGFGHYGSQVAMFTLSGLAIGVAVDLAPVAGGLVSAALMGAGFAGAFAAPSGDWSQFGWDSLTGAGFGVGVWGVGKVAAPLLGPVAVGLAGTALGRAVIAGGTRIAGSSLGSGAIGAFNGARNMLGEMAEQTWGNQIVSSITGPILNRHLANALAGQGVSQADLALMNRMVGETFETLQTGATTWGGFRDAFWRAARQTNAFATLFPNATGTGAPIYGNLGRLNIHHLVGRTRDLVFAESNLALVPNALDTPFAHSAQYLTGTQQWAIRRGLRQLFPRQWTSGMLGAAATQLGLLEEGEQGAVC